MHRGGISRSTGRRLSGSVPVNRGSMRGVRFPGARAGCRTDGVLRPWSGTGRGLRPPGREEPPWGPHPPSELRRRWHRSRCCPRQRRGRRRRCFPPPGRPPCGRSRVPGSGRDGRAGPTGSVSVAGVVFSSGPARNRSCTSRGMCAIMAMPDDVLWMQEPPGHRGQVGGRAVPVQLFQVQHAAGTDVGNGQGHLFPDGGVDAFEERKAPASEFLKRVAAGGQFPHLHAHAVVACLAAVQQPAVHQVVGQPVGGAAGHAR